MKGGRSLKWQLTAICLALLVPTLLFVGVLLWQYAASERSRVEEQARALSRGLAVTLDREMTGILTTLQALATSPSLQSGDLATFYGQLIEVRKLQGIHLSLRDVSGHALMTTRSPFGVVLPVPSILAQADQDVLRSGTAAVSNVYTSAVSGKPVFQVVAAPILVGGKPTYILAAGLDLDFLVDAIRREHLPQGWLGALVDRNGIFAVRTERQDDYAGKPTSADFHAHAVDDIGSYYGHNRAGLWILAGYARSPLTGWIASATVDASIVAAPIHRSLLILVALGLCLGTIATAIAFVVGRRIDGAMRRLNEAAKAIGGGHRLEGFATPIAEVNQVGRALAMAASQLYVRARERDDAEAALRELAASLEVQVEARTAALMATEDRLRQSQKMEAVGQLTGGIAHDFNNLLAGISGSLELMQTRLGQGRIGELDRYIIAAQGAARRAAALTHRLLAFSRRQTLDPKPTDVNRLVVGMEELIRRTVGPGIHLEVVNASGLWPTFVDPGQLENALLNLCINARDAMPDGGRITVETANKWMDERAGKERDLPSGQYLCLSVSDTGTGMTPEVVAKAFDPFFTTKPMGQGTGLGLSMIHGFTRQSGGQVRIYSEMGQGTTMSLYFPRYYGKTIELEGHTEVDTAPRAERGETVLIVDDEPTVRMLVKEVLDDLGYDTVEAADGPAGLKFLNSNRRIDLLITDVGLPHGMNGRQLADAARVTRPDLKVLFITGYAENAIIGNGHLDPGMQVMTKPFVMEGLASKIRELISAP